MRIVSVIFLLLPLLHCNSLQAQQTAVPAPYELEQKLKVNPVAATQTARQCLESHQELSTADRSMCLYYLARGLAVQMHHDSALSRFESLKEASEKQEDTFYLVRSMLQIAQISVKQDKPGYARSLLKKCKKLFPEIQDTSILIQTLIGFADVSCRENAGNQELDYLTAAHRLANKAFLSYELGLASQRLGHFYRHNAKFETAIQYLDESYGIAQLDGDVNLLVQILLSRGRCYLQYGYEDEGLRDITEATGICGRLRLDRFKTEILIERGNYFLDQAKYEEALKIFSTAAGLAINNRDNDKQAKAEYYRGNCWLHLNEYDSATAAFESALEPAKNAKSRYVVADVYAGISTVYDSLGKYKEAFEYFQKSVDERRAALEEEKAKRITDVRLKYELKQKDDSLKLSAAKLVFFEDQKRTKEYEIITGFFAIGMVILIIGGLVLFFSLRMKKIRQRALLQEEIDKERILVLMKSRETATMDAWLKGQTKERKRTSEELHDNLGSMLATVKLRFSGVEEHLRGELHQQFLNAIHLLDDTCAEVRILSHNLLGKSDNSFSLVPALKEMAVLMEGQSQVKISVLVNGQSQPLGPPEEMAIYGVVQEITVQLLQWTQAPEATISLNYSEALLNILMEYSGQGYDLEIDTEAAAFASKINSQAEYIHAEIAIDSNPLAGTTVIIDISLQQDSL